jgi:hypothetical protein
MSGARATERLPPVRNAGLGLQLGPAATQLPAEHSEGGASHWLQPAAEAEESALRHLPETSSCLHVQRGRVELPGTPHIPARPAVPRLVVQSLTPWETFVPREMPPTGYAPSPAITPSPHHHPPPQHPFAAAAPDGSSCIRWRRPHKNDSNTRAATAAGLWRAEKWSVCHLCSARRVCSRVRPAAAAGCRGIIERAVCCK